MSIFFLTKRLRFGQVKALVGIEKIHHLITKKDHRITQRRKKIYKETVETGSLVTLNSLELISKTVCILWITHSHKYITLIWLPPIEQLSPTRRSLVFWICEIRSQARSLYAFFSMFFSFFFLHSHSQYFFSRARNLPLQCDIEFTS